MGLLGALLVPLFLWIPPSWRHEPLIGSLGARYHIGLFFILTLLLYARGPLRGRLGRVVVVCLLLGGATELLQTRFGRSACWTDWLLDAQGIGFGVCWIWYRRTRRRTLPLIGAAALLLLVFWPLRTLPVRVQEYRAAQARFPLLEDFDRPQTLIHWSRRKNISRALVAVEERGRVLQIANHDQERWPGITTRRLPWDWSGYDELHVDCRLVAPSPDSLRVTIWLEDRAGRRDVDYATKSFMVGHNWRTLVVPLDELVTENRQRRVARREITAISILVTRRQPGPIRLQIDELRLIDTSGRSQDGDRPEAPRDGHGDRSQGGTSIGGAS